MLKFKHFIIPSLILVVIITCYSCGNNEAKPTAESVVSPVSKTDSLHIAATYSVEFSKEATTKDKLRSLTEIQQLLLDTLIQLHGNADHLDVKTSFRKKDSTQHSAYLMSVFTNLPFADSVGSGGTIIPPKPPKYVTKINSAIE